MSDDPLDQEFVCPACDGVGGFDEGGVDGVMRGSPDDYITCFNCKGSGSIAPTFHPGEDGKGARGMTVFDTREEQHRKDYDVENAMPYGNRIVQTGDGRIIDPYRQGFPRDGDVKMTRENIAPQEQIANTEPALRHRMPSVYMREMGGQPTNTGLNITGDPKRGGHPLFTMGNPMDMAWRMLKHDE